MEKSSEPVGNISPPPLANFPQNHLVDGNAQNVLKLKLQLFPIDDGTRRALEMVMIV